MSDSKHIVCPACAATNRIPVARLGDSPTCGKCRQPLFTPEPVTLNGSNFLQHINRSDVPVVVDFWAPWCGPCKMMAPSFGQASAELIPQARLAKLNTEDEQVLAGQFNIRSIPTMVMFKNGREIARQSGAMGAQDIKNWVQSYL